MQLHLLGTTPCLTIYYDSQNDWLFLDWQGDLTLVLVQEACVEVGNCLLERPYRRVLNSNAQVTDVSLSVAAWLVTEFMPHSKLAGIEHLAWVGSPSLRGRSVVQTVVSWLAQASIDIFHDLDEAVGWLQHLGPPTMPEDSLPQRLPADQAKLAQIFHRLAQKVAARRPLFQQ